MNLFGKLKAVIQLKRILTSRGIMQSWVADRLEISPAYLSLLLNGKRRLTSSLCEDFNLLTNHIKGERRDDE